jgi:hypothetical protein
MEQFNKSYFHPLILELNPFTQSCLPRFLLGILIFKGVIGRHLYKSFGVKGLTKKNPDFVWYSITAIRKQDKLIHLSDYQKSDEF